MGTQASIIQGAIVDVHKEQTTGTNCFCLWVEEWEGEEGGRSKKNVTLNGLGRGSSFDPPSPPPPPPKPFNVNLFPDTHQTIKRDIFY